MIIKPNVFAERARGKNRERDPKCPAEVRRRAAEAVVEAAEECGSSASSLCSFAAVSMLAAPPACCCRCMLRCKLCARVHCACIWAGADRVIYVICTLIANHNAPETLYSSPCTNSKTRRHACVSIYIFRYVVCRPHQLPPPAAASAAQMLPACAYFRVRDVRETLNLATWSHADGLAICTRCV